MEKRIKLLFIFPTPQVWGGEEVWLNLLRRINRKKFSISILTFGTGRLLKRLEDINVKYYSLEKARLRNVFGSVKNLFRMIKFLKKEKFNIVNSLGVHLLTTLSTSIVPIRYILHFHTMHPLPLIDRWCIRKAKHIITVSNFTKELLISYGTKPNCIKMIYNGIDIEGFEKKIKGVDLRKELRLQEETQIICYIGRIIKSKNLETLVQIIPKIKKDYQGKAKFLFVGDTPKINPREADYKDVLLKLAEELRVKDDVIFTGRREDITSILKQIDIFALPSNFLEVCSMAILEAMAMAKPVVAIRVGGNPELVSEETGILVNPNDLNGFAKGIIDLLKDKEKAFMIGGAGKRRVKEYFSIEKNVKMTEELYEEILSRNIL